MSELVQQSTTGRPSFEAVHQTFEQRVAECPDAVAIATPIGNWSYTTLNSLANRVANGLRRLGVVPGDLVAVATLRSPETIASILGVLKVGAAYVPLDPGYPDERLRFMLSDTRAKCLLADNSCASRLGAGIPEGCQLVPLQNFAEESPDAVSHSGRGTDLFAILYTSGSTGTPKGVMLVHEAITRLVIHPDFVEIRPDDVFSHFAPLSFDTSLFEIFGPLLNGARVVVTPASANSLSDIADAVERFGVTTMWLTSGLFSVLIDECPHFVRRVRQLVVGGDVISVPHARKAVALMENGRMINGYGPTENTTFSTAHHITAEDLKLPAIPIGRAIRGSGVCILKEDLRPVTGNEDGEIHVTGIGLARGYWNRPELTESRFIEIETSPGTRERAYKTGDLGRYRPDGTIDFLGRIDTQVKIRGFRIELTEIETRMAECEGVAAAVVVPVATAGAAEKHLRLCYVLRKGATITAAQAESFLRERLPAYSVPNEFLQLESLPLDPNGKVARKALAQLELQPAADIAEIVPAISQLNPVQEELLRMLRELLKSPKVSIDDDFFLVGGHSLLAARLFAQIEARWGRRLPLALMLQVRTLRNLAAAVEQREHGSAWSSLVPLRKGSSATPVFLLHAIGGNVIGYHELAVLLPEDVPVFGIQAQGLDGVTRLPATVEEMASNYVGQIRAVQPQGPYFLCGFSAGGVLAFEVAHQLEQAGQRVGLVGLIDSNLTSSLAGTARQRGLWAAVMQASHVVRWNLWYSTQIGLGSFLQKKIRNSMLNLRIAGSALLRMLTPWRKNNEVIRLSVEEAFLRAMRRYDPKKIVAKAILFRTADSELYDPNQEAAWRRALEGGLEVCTVTGTHETMLESPNLEMLVAEFVNAMDHVKSSSLSGSILALKSAASKSDRLQVASVARGA